MQTKIEQICLERNLSPLVFNNPEKLTAASVADLTDWAYEHIYSIPYVHKSPNEEHHGIARFSHGIQHVSRVALYIPVLANLFARYNKEIIDEDDLYLLQIAALFHDSARKHDGRDCWDKESATLLFAFLVNRLGIKEQKAKQIAEAVANKDAEENNPYFELNIETGEWLESQARPKNIYQNLIHDADCLDIIRARNVFDAAYLDFYKKIAKENDMAFEEMATLINEVRSLIALQGDARAKTYPLIKKQLEGPGIFNKNKAMINRKYPSFPLLQKLHTHLLDKEELSSLKFYMDKCFDENAGLTEENLSAALNEGKLLIRGIGAPSTKLDERKGTYAEQEIYKTLRRPTVSTRANNPAKRLEKNGNPNRSTILLIRGGNVYASTGFLILNPTLEAMTSISNRDSDSGRGKKKNFIYKTMSTTEKENKIKQLVRKQKMGGEAPHGSALLAYNEITYKITEVDAIYFTRDPVLYNDMSEFIDQPDRAILEAIYLQQAYFKQTGKTLPIYEYSGQHHFCKQAPHYTEDDIFHLWVDLARRYLSEHIDECYAIPDGTVCLLYGKTRAKVPPYGDIQSLDQYYSEDLKNKIRLAIEKEKTKNFKESIEKDIQLIRNGEKRILERKFGEKPITFLRLVNIPGMANCVKQEIHQQLNDYLSQQFLEDKKDFDIVDFYLNQYKSLEATEEGLYDNIPVLKAYFLAQLTDHQDTITVIDKFIHEKTRDLFKTLKELSQSDDPQAYANFYSNTRKMHQIKYLIVFLICTQQDAYVAKIQQELSKMPITREILASFKEVHEFHRSRRQLDQLGLLNSSHIDFMRDIENHHKKDYRYWPREVDDKGNEHIKPPANSTWKPAEKHDLFQKGAPFMSDNLYSNKQNFLTYAFLLREKNKAFIAIRKETFIDTTPAHDAASSEELLHDTCTTNDTALLEDPSQEIVAKRKPITQSNSNLATSSSSSTSSANQKLIAQDFGLVRICRLFETSLGGVEFFSSVALVFDNEDNALSFRKSLWNKCEQEKIDSINVVYSNFNKLLYPTQCIFKVVVCANSDIDFQIRKNELNSGDILLKELETIVDLTGVPQHDTDYYGRMKNQATTVSDNLIKFSILYQEPVLIKADISAPSPAETLP
ncbi:hypothetical protein Lnau_2570 [Legionella nautarum]|uniref:Uncharacterized protein n=1 Tax=Legionella nautarum TaxID=45070 RepID=A0A0W0WKS5_9GAMM|nr:hypothetical protein Lnau_2570 [Legionella nautarum]